MRKPIEIEREKAGPLFKECVRRAHWLDTCANCNMSRTGMYGLTSAIKTIIVHVLKEGADADAELGFGPEPPEAAAREYLRSLIR